MTMTIVDCERCDVRQLACGDCVMSALVRAPEGVATVGPALLDDEECRVLQLFADSGLLPPLRLASGLSASVGPAVVPAGPPQRRCA